MAAIESSRRCRQIIVESFCPRIGILESDDMSQFLQEAGALSLKELMDATSESLQVTIRTSHAQTKRYDNFRIRYFNYGDLGFQPTADSLEDSLRSKLNEMQNGSDEFFTSWYREMITSDTAITPFETFQHPSACVLAVSSRNTNPIEVLSSLYQDSYDSRAGPYVNVDFLRYFVLCHHSGDDIERSKLLMGQIKQLFGSNVALLVAKEPTEVSDNSLVTGIKEFNSKMVNQAVIPFMERCYSYWSDHVNSSKQGFAGRLLNASKRYLSSPTKLNVNVLEHVAAVMTQKPLKQPDQATLAAAHVALKSDYNTPYSHYHYLASPAQLRKIADFAFMLREYKSAHAIYDMLKKEFNNDKAWAYFASCQEMTALSFLLMTDSLQPRAGASVLDPLLDSSVYTYVSRCDLPYNAIRCVLTSAEVLCTLPTDIASGEFATKWLIKLLEDHLVGNLLHVAVMERISNAYLVFYELQAPPKKQVRARKAALWRILAARDWKEAGLPQQSERCLEQSLAIDYDRLPWAQRADTLLGRLKQQQVHAVQERAST